MTTTNASKRHPPPRIPSTEFLYAAVMKYNRRLQGLDPDPTDKPYDGPTCRHNNPLGNCFDCGE